MAELTVPAPALPTTVHGDRLIVTARLGALFRIVYVNLILTILTLGIYRFWAKTKLRRYIWRHLVVGGESFEYTGTGKELLLGFLKAVLVLLPPLVIIGLLELFIGSPWDAIIGVLKYLAIAVVFAAGTYAARRYRMSRTTWSGIRFHQAGSPWEYARLYVKGVLLTLVTFGLYVPYFGMRLQAYETVNLHLGSEPFRFTGVGRDLFKRWLVVWLLLLVSLALAAVMAFLVAQQFAGAANQGDSLDVSSLAPFGALLLAYLLLLPVLLWYRAAALRYYAAHTSLAGVRFAMTVRGRSLLGFYLMNGLILVVSLGILFPVLVRRRVTFWARWLTLDGMLDLSLIHQTDRGPRTGEGLANFFDMDFLGV